MKDNVAIMSVLPTPPRYSFTRPGYYTCENTPYRPVPVATPADYTTPSGRDAYRTTHRLHTTPSPVDVSLGYDYGILFAATPTPYPARALVCHYLTLPAPRTTLRALLQRHPAFLPRHYGDLPGWTPHRRLPHTPTLPLPGSGCCFLFTVGCHYCTATRLHTYTFPYARTTGTGGGCCLTFIYRYHNYHDNDMSPHTRTAACPFTAGEPHLPDRHAPTIHHLPVILPLYQWLNRPLRGCRSPHTHTTHGFAYLLPVAVYLPPPRLAPPPCLPSTPRFASHLFVPYYMPITVWFPTPPPFCRLVGYAYQSITGIGRECEKRHLK